MAEAKPKPDKRKDRHRFLALQKPRITVLTDQPLATREAYRESFALDFRMGPVLDIVRHPVTRTPRRECSRQVDDLPYRVRDRNGDWGRRLKAC